MNPRPRKDTMSESPTRATDEQRARVRVVLADYVDVLDEPDRDAIAAILADSEALAARGGLAQPTASWSEPIPDPRTLDLIAWSLRLPLLRDARAKRSVLPGAQTGPPEPESARLDALIAEGERALGILPPEEAS